MYWKVKDEIEIREAVETLGQDYMQLSEEGRKAYGVLCMKLHLYVE